MQHFLLGWMPAHLFCMYHWHRLYWSLYIQYPGLFVNHLQWWASGSLWFASCPWISPISFSPAVIGTNAKKDFKHYFGTLRNVQHECVWCCWKDQLLFYLPKVSVVMQLIACFCLFVHTKVLSRLIHLGPLEMTQIIQIALFCYSHHEW